MHLSTQPSIISLEIFLYMGAFFNPYQGMIVFTTLVLKFSNKKLTFHILEKFDLYFITQSINHWILSNTIL